MSTKRNDNARALGGGLPSKGRGVSYRNRLVNGLRLELAYFSGYARLAEWRTGSAGVILRFERVRPALTGRVQPLKSREITLRVVCARGRGAGALKVRHRLERGGVSPREPAQVGPALRLPDIRWRLSGC